MHLTVVEVDVIDTLSLEGEFSTFWGERICLKRERNVSLLWP